MTVVASPEDIKIWTGFVDAAERCANRHLAWLVGETEPVADKLFGAEKRVRRRTMPWGQAVIGSPLYRLHTLARDWRGYSFERRRETAKAMADLVADVRRAWVHRTDSRLRKDIYG